MSCWRTLTGRPVEDVVAFVRESSSAYVQELVGLVVSQGFRAVIKPGSWAASRAADRLVRVAPSLTRDEADRAPGPAVRPPQPLIGEAHSVNGI